MALFKIVFSLLLLAAAEESEKLSESLDVCGTLCLQECDNSERDEVQLLQAQD